MTFAIAWRYSGMSWSCQNVPARNIIGNPIAFDKALADSESFAKEPMIIPRLAKRTDPATMKAIVRRSKRICTFQARIPTTRVATRERIMDKVNQRIFAASHSDFLRVVVARSLKYFRVRYSA